MEITSHPTTTPPEEDALYFDNTRVSAFFKCPRSYYFRHVRGWQSAKPSVPLAFGGAMHSAMEVVWGEYHNVNSQRELLEMAMQAFAEKWTAEGFSMDGINLDQKRNPGLAMDIIASYIDKYDSWLNKVQVLAIEQPFVVPLMQTPNDAGLGDIYIHYIGRWDKVWREANDFIFVGEHKTTSLYRTATIFAREWMEAFSPDNQVDGYLYAAMAVYGEKARGVIIDGIMVHKTVRGFTRIPVQRAMHNLDAWKWGVSYWINEIIENISMLTWQQKQAPGADFLMAFPQRTEHCQHKYGQCAYLNVCKYGSANPETIEEPPEGFKHEIWDPFAHNVEEGQQPMIVGSGG